MAKSKLHFSNGEELVINIYDEIFGIRTSDSIIPDNADKMTKDFYFNFPKAASISRPLQVDSHHHAGVIPFFVELFANYDYFQLVENDPIAYSCSSVVKIEHIE